MERNFLGIGGKDSGAEDGRGGHVDSAFSVGSAVKWPLSKEASAMQQCMPFKTQQEEKTKNILFDPISSTAFQPISTVGVFVANSKACTRQAPQISFGVDRHSVQQFSVHNYQNQDVDDYRASAHLAPVSHTSIPIGMSSPFFKVHGSSSGPNLTGTVVKPQPFRSVVANNNCLLGAGVGSFTPRNVVKPLPTTAQLTIFYAGSVNVYDDVPWNKAQAVMLMANEGFKATENAVHSTSQDDPSKTTSTSIVAGTAATILPRVNSCSLDGAVPQARKASLARFLEKRKERVSNTMPYSIDQKPSKNLIVPDVAAPSSNCSDSRVSLTSNQDFSWFKGQAKNFDDNGDNPWTKLEM